MIAYNTTWLANLHVHEKVKIDAGKGLITPAEYAAITDTYPVGFYTPNLFVRAGLILLTCVIVLFSDGLLSLAVVSGGPNISAWFIFLGVLTYIALEIMVHANHHYRSGVDDALLWIAALQLGGGICGLLTGNHQPDYMALAGVALLLSIILTLRFTDALMSAAAVAAFLIFIFYLWIRIVPAGLSTAPFVMMFVSGGLYWLFSKLIRQQGFPHYHDCLQLGQVVALLAFYGAGNYYVIQTLGSAMADTQGPVPFGVIFWVWTFAIPAVYIFFGVRKKDDIRLRIGLLLVVAAGFTFRNYYHLLPPDVMLTIVGTILLSLVFGISKYLKTPKHGITANEPEDVNELDKLKVESLVAAGSFSHAPAAPTNSGNSSFGGGSFGGGGSSSGY